MGNKWERIYPPSKTKNNDIYWQCPICGGTKHYFGFDNPVKKTICVVCGTVMKGYKW